MNLSLECKYYIPHQVGLTGKWYIEDTKYRIYAIQQHALLHACTSSNVVCIQLELIYTSTQRSKP